MADDEKRRLVEGLMKMKLQEDGDEKARQYVEMPEIPLPEEEIETGSSKAQVAERMRKLAQMGAIGMGTTAMGAGIRDVGLAVSSATSQMGGGRIDVKSIARKADALGKSVPRETARYLRSSSGEWSPNSPAMNKKTPLEMHTKNSVDRSNSVSSAGSNSEPSTEAKSPVSRRTSIGVVAKAASEQADSSESDTRKEPLNMDKPASTSPVEESSLKLDTKLPPAASTSPSIKLPAVSPVTTSPPVGTFVIKPINADLSPAIDLKSSTPSPSKTKANAALKPSPFNLPKANDSVGTKPMTSEPLSPANAGSRRPSTTEKKPATSSFVPPPTKTATTTTKVASFIPPPKQTPVSPSKPTTSVPSTKTFGSKAPESAPKPSLSPKAPAVEVIDTDPNRKYTLEELQTRTPTDVISGKKEDYLKLSEFKKAFGVDPDTFAKYPDWKKVTLRKDAKIF